MTWKLSYISLRVNVSTKIYIGSVLLYAYETTRHIESEIYEYLRRTVKALSGNIKRLASLTRCMPSWLKFILVCWNWVLHARNSIANGSMQLKSTIYVLIVSSVCAMICSTADGFSFPTSEATAVDDETNDRSYNNRRYNDVIHPSLINSINSELPKEAKFFDLNDFDCK